MSVLAGAVFSSADVNIFLPSGQTPGPPPAPGANVFSTMIVAGLTVCDTLSSATIQANTLYQTPAVASISSIITNSAGPTSNIIFTTTVVVTDPSATISSVYVSSINGIKVSEGINTNLVVSTLTAATFVSSFALSTFELLLTDCHASSISTQTCSASNIKSLSSINGIPYAPIVYPADLVVSSLTSFSASSPIGNLSSITYSSINGIDPHIQIPSNLKCSTLSLGGPLLFPGFLQSGFVPSTIHTFKGSNITGINTVNLLFNSTILYSTLNGNVSNYFPISGVIQLTNSNNSSVWLNCSQSGTLQKNFNGGTQAGVITLTPNNLTPIYLSNLQTGLSRGFFTPATILITPLFGAPTAWSGTVRAGLDGWGSDEFGAIGWAGNSGATLYCSGNGGQFSYIIRGLTQ